MKPNKENCENIVKQCQLISHTYKAINLDRKTLKTLEEFGDKRYDEIKERVRSRLAGLKRMANNAQRGLSYLQGIYKIGIGKPCIVTVNSIQTGANLFFDVSSRVDHFIYQEHFKGHIESKKLQQNEANNSETLPIQQPEWTQGQSEGSGNTL